MGADHLLEIRNLKTYFEVRRSLLKAVDDVSLSIEAGKTLGLVGESGCGKSVTAASIMGLVPIPPGKIAGGEILFEGVNLLKLSESKMKKIRGNRISMIFQEPMTSLNPVFTVGDQVAEVIRLHQGLSRREIRNKVIEMFYLVGIPAAESRIKDYPHQMSGGMRQRVVIAMALACNPKLMIADEPTTALDVTIQAQILDLMNKLKEEAGASILFITHDLGVIAEMAQNVAVMYAGKVVEGAEVGSLLSHPYHPYTRALITAIPDPDPANAETFKKVPSGEPPNLLNPPSGCRFHPRCPVVMDICSESEPEFKETEPGHHVACWHVNP